MSKRLAGLIAAAALAACTPATEPPATEIAAEPVAPTAMTCPTPDPNQACRADTHELAENFQKAMTGDYQAQRNTAWAFGGESPYIEADPVQACAWRKVIASTRPADASYTDEAQLKLDCDALTPDQLTGAEQLSTRILSALA